MHKQTHIKTQTDLLDTTHIRIPKQNFIKGFMSNYLNSQDYFKLKPAVGFFDAASYHTVLLCQLSFRALSTLQAIYFKVATGLSVLPVSLLQISELYHHILPGCFLAFSHCAPTAKKTPTECVWDKAPFRECEKAKNLFNKS